MTGLGIIVFSVFGILIAMVLYSFYYCKKLEDKNKPKLIEALKSNNILNSNIKVCVQFKNYDGCLVYTNENKLFHIGYFGDVIGVEEINLNEILDIKVDIHIKEKSQMRIISVVPTFDRYQLIQRVNMIITTEDKVYDLNIDDGIMFNADKVFLNSTVPNKSWEKRVQELNRLKLLIEKNITTTNRDA